MLRGKTTSSQKIFEVWIVQVWKQVQIYPPAVGCTIGGERYPPNNDFFSTPAERHEKQWHQSYWTRWKWKVTTKKFWTLIWVLYWACLESHYTVDSDVHTTNSNCQFVFALLVPRLLYQVWNNLLTTCIKLSSPVLQALTTLIQSWYNKIVTKLTTQGCKNIVILWLISLVGTTL